MQTLTLTLDDEQFERLRDQAEARGVPVETYAADALVNATGSRPLVISGRWGYPPDRERLLSALQRLRERRQTLPAANLTQLLWESREDLESRGDLP